MKCFFHFLAKFFHRERRRLAQTNQPLLLFEDLPRSSGNLIGDFQWNRLHTVYVAVKQISRVNFHMPNLYVTSKIEDVRKGVRDGDASSKQLEPSCPYRGQIAHGTIGHQPYASQCQEYICVNLADK